MSRDAVYKDAVTGQPLRASLVIAARKLELEYFASKTVWEKRPHSEAFARTGKKPITVRKLSIKAGGEGNKEAW